MNANGLVSYSVYCWNLKQSGLCIWELKDVQQRDKLNAEGQQEDKWNNLCPIQHTVLEPQVIRTKNIHIMSTLKRRYHTHSPAILTQTWSNPHNYCKFGVDPELLFIGGYVLVLSIKDVMLTLIH